MSVFNLFKKKKPPDPQLATAPFCHHKWQEFPWYMDSNFIWSDPAKNIGEQKIEIYKPYVCVHCKERKNVFLGKTNRMYISHEEGDKFVDAIKKDYATYIEDRLIVESKINDFQLVDHEYLAIIEGLRTYDISPEKLKEYSNEKKEED